MTTITVDELETRLREVVDRIASGGEPVFITRDGVAITEINPTIVAATEPVVTATSPTPPRTQEERDAYWAELDQLARDIAEIWPKGVSALDAVREQRREL